jgi:hypothetical protein
MRNSTTSHMDESGGVTYIILTTSFVKRLEPPIHRPVLPFVQLQSLASKHAGLHIIHPEEVLPFLRQEQTPMRSWLPLL